MEGDDYGASAGMEYVPDSDDERLTSPGSTYTIGGGRYLGLPPALGGRDDHSARSSQRISPGPGGREQYAETTSAYSARGSFSATDVGGAAQSAPFGTSPPLPGVDALNALANRASLFTPSSAERGASDYTAATTRYAGNSYQQQQATAAYVMHGSSGAFGGNVTSEQRAVEPQQRPGPTVVTASGAVVHGPPSDTGRLALKVQAQARELGELTAALTAAQAYSHKVERRLLELLPEHPLPVTDAELGTVAGRLSKLARAAAEELTGGASPGKVLGVASHIVSATAADRRAARDSGSVIRNLERQLEKSRRQADDAQARIKELRTAVDAKEKDRIAALRRAEGLSQKVISLEAEMRLAGITPTLIATPGTAGVGSGAGPHALHSAPEASIIMPSAGAGPQSIHDIPTLTARMRILEAELDSARATRDSAQEALGRESRASADARAHILSLERALHENVVEAGLPSDVAGLRTTVARLRGELEGRVRAHAAKEAEGRDMVAQLRAASARIASLESSASNSFIHNAVSAAGGGGPSHPSHTFSTPGRRQGQGAVGGGGVVVSSPFLGVITLSSHVSAPGAVEDRERAIVAQDSLARLEAEKGALLDYIGEIRDAYAELQSQSESVSRERTMFEGQAARARGAAMEAGHEAETARATAETATRQLQEIQKQLSSSSERVKELTASYSSASSSLAEKAGEIMDLAAVQTELLDVIRTDKGRMAEASLEADGLRRRISDLQRKLEVCEATLDHTEAERDGLEGRVHSLLRQGKEVSAGAEAAGKAQAEASAAAQRATAERRALETRLSSAESTLQDMTAERDSLSARLRDTEASHGAMSVQLDTLRRVASSVASAESNVARFLKVHGARKDVDNEGAGVPRVGPRSGREGAGRVSGDGYASLVDPEGEDEDEGSALALPGPGQGYSVHTFRPSGATGAGLGIVEYELDEERDAGRGRMRSPSRPGMRQGAGSTRSMGSPGRPVNSHEGHTNTAAEDDAPAYAAVQASATAGKKALARAEEALAWANEAAVNNAVPQTASAARQLAGWLRTAGSALADTARRLSQELEDRRLQRSMLYEEVHSLRDALAACRDSLLVERRRSVEAESKLASISAARTEEVSSLSRRYSEASGERDRLKGAYETASASLASTSKEAAASAAQAESLAGQVDGLTVAKNAAVSRVETLAKELHACSVERDSLADQLRDTHRSLMETRSHNGVLEKERSDAIGRLIVLEREAAESAHTRVSLEGHRSAAAGRIAELTAALEAAGRDKSTGLEKQSRLVSELEATQELVNGQAELVEQLQGRMAAAGEDRGALQRTLTGLGMELETARSSLESICAEFEGKAAVMIASLAKLGVDTAVVSSAGREGVAPVLGPTGGGDRTQARSAAAAAYSDIHAVVGRARSALAVLHAGASTAGARVSSLLSETGGLKAEIGSMRPRLEAVQEVVHTASDRGRALSAAENTIADLRAQLAGAEASLTSAQQEMASMRSRMVEQAGEVERANTRIAMLVGEGEAAREAERRAAAVLVEAHGRIGGLEEELDRMRRDADTLVSQRARAEASTHREVGRLNDMAGELATLTAQKQRAEGAAQRAAEAGAAARAEALDARTEAGALNARIAALEREVQHREGEVTALRHQLRSMAAVQTELETQVARDIKTLSHETAEAMASRTSLETQLALRHAETETLRAELAAARGLPRAQGVHPYAAELSRPPLPLGRVGGAGSRAPSPAPAALPQPYPYGGPYAPGGERGRDKPSWDSFIAGPAYPTQQGQGQGVGYQSGASSLTGTPTRAGQRPGSGSTYTGSGGGGESGGSAGVYAAEASLVAARVATLAMRQPLTVPPPVQVGLFTADAASGQSFSPVEDLSPLSPESPGMGQRVERLRKAQERFKSLQQSQGGGNGSGNQ